MGLLPTQPKSDFELGSDDRSCMRECHSETFTLSDQTAGYLTSLTCFDIAQCPSADET